MTTFVTNCAGFVIFYENETVMVKTKHGHYGFPKGKRNKGETSFQTAIRELEEETGIRQDEIAIKIFYNDEDYITIVENTNDKPNITYYIAELINRRELRCQDPEELDTVEYMNIDTALNIENRWLKTSRKIVLREAYKFYTQDIEKECITLNDTDARYVSKSLSWILRHGILKEGLVMDTAGYVLLNDVLNCKQFKNHYNTEHIMYVVDNNEKQRFKIINVDGNYYIRANQGHCEEVGNLLRDEDMMTLIEEPLPICIHGTTKKAIKEIKNSGLTSMSRKHIHLASGTDAISGLRQSSKVIIHINMEKAMNDGKRFFMSDNGVILTMDDIPNIYFKKIEYV